MGSIGTEGTIFRKLIEVPVKRLKNDLNQYKVQTIHSTDTLPEAFRKLCTENILGAPVIDSLGYYKGMVSMNDLLNYTLDLMDDTTRPIRFSPEYLQKKRVFRENTVGNITNLPDVNGKFIPCNENYSLFHALEILCNTDSDRITLLDNKNLVSSVLTDSMFIRYIIDNKSLLSSELLNTTLGELRSYHSIVTMLSSRRAIDAFRLMKEKDNINAIAVVNSSGVISDVLSTRDLIGVSPNSLTFRWLWNTISFYLDQVREQQGSKKPSRIIALTSANTFGDLLAKIEETPVHQVFLVDSLHTMKPIDYISLNDILNFVLDSIQLGGAAI